MLGLPRNAVFIPNLLILTDVQIRKCLRVSVIRKRAHVRFEVCQKGREKNKKSREKMMKSGEKNIYL